MTWNQFPPGSYHYTCAFTNGVGNATFSIYESTEPETWDNGRTCYDTVHGDQVWVVVNGVSSNQITVP